MHRTIVIATCVFFATSLPVTRALTTKSTLLKRASGVSRTPTDAADQTFDYVVVGGGLTGITVASRLTENPSTTVLVLEAGEDNRLDKRVQDIYTYMQAFNTELDWQFLTDYGKQMVASVVPCCQP